MAEIVLFHSVLGVRPGVTDAASRLEALGHTVHVPNLYAEDAVFDDYEQASAYVDAMGYPELMRRSGAAVEALPSDLVYAGFSNGGGSAEYLAATRPGARGALLFSAALPLALFGQFGQPIESWPGSVPVQVHYMVDDPFREQEFLDAFAADVRRGGAPFTLHEYPGAAHLFTDASLPAEYDEAAAALLWERVAAFLRDLV